MLNDIYSCALKLLTRREHSKLELEHKLSNKGFAVEDIQKVLQKLIEQNLQSDDRFIEAYIRMRAQKGFGPLRIELELGERGIDKEKLQGFLNSNDQVWFDLAETVRLKKFGKAIPADFQQKAKQMRYLHQKGFTSDQINSACQKTPLFRQKIP